MKKAIIVTVTMLSFLIGCSFSKDKGSENLKKISTPTTLEGKIQLLDVDTLKKELANLSDSDREELLSNPNLYLTIAIQRGSYDATLALIEAGVSPFELDQHDHSIYNEAIINSTHSSLLHALNSGGRDQASFYLESYPLSALIKKVSEKSIPCDSAIFEIARSKVHRTDLLEFLKEVHGCRYLVRPENLRDVLSKYFDIYIKSDFQSSDTLVELFKVLPPEVRLIRIRETYGQDYLIHPIVILQAISELNSTKIGNTNSLLKSFSTDSDISIISRIINQDGGYKAQVLSDLGHPLPEVSLQKIQNLIRKHYSTVCQGAIPSNLSEERCMEFRHLDIEKLNDDKQELSQ